MSQHLTLNQKYAGADPNNNHVPYYRVASNVNNQLGTLYDWLRYYAPLKLNNQGFDPVPCMNNIYYYENVVPEKLAKKCRQFLNDISFINRPLLNDIINPPNYNVYCDLKDHYLATEAILNATDSPKDWIWERYHTEFYRASPLTKEAFAGSPIVELFDYLSTKFITVLERSVWVIQLVPKGNEIGWHMDDNGHRKIAFIYYLTPDDITIQDGGELICLDCKTKQLLKTFVPTFNSLVLWDMAKEYGPLHKVNTVNIHNRIALVGFYV